MAGMTEARQAATDELRTRLEGSVLEARDDGYEEARRIWNGTVDKRPAVIARCSGVTDVVGAVTFAREQRLELAVRGGGHGVAGYAISDGGLVVDLSGMKAIHVDSESRTVRAEAGCTLADVDRATQAHGLATPLGVVSQTGIAGLTLGGGLGWMRRKHGLSVDNLVSVDVVTADGRVLTASEAENSDLFWGLRGGGGNFGVVTSFEYRLHRVGPEVMVLFVLYPASLAREVLRFQDEVMATAPDEIGGLAFLGRVPHAEAFPSETHGSPYVALAGLYIGDRDEGAQVFAPWRALGEPLADLSGTMPYVEAQSLLDEDYPDGWRYYWKALDLETMDDEVIDRLVDAAAAAPSHHSTIDVWYHGGAMGRVAADATAFGHRALYGITYEANWESETDDADNIAWARRGIAELEGFSRGGGYLNFPGLLEGGDAQVRASYGANYERLVALKDAYDPENLFRLNGNIPPSGG